MTLDMFGLDVDMADVRSSLAQRHPMLDQDYTILTPEIQAFHDATYDWVVARKSGLYAVGLYRQGKSKALAFTIDQLRVELPFMTFHRCEGKRLASQTKAQFCADLLMQWAYPAALLKRARAEVVLENYLMTSCAHVGGKHCVLFIDEAGLWGITQYRYLLEIWNSLRRQGYLLSTVLVGQEQLISLRTLSNELDHGAVVARFFVKRHKFSGIREASTLSKVLRSYDSSLFYPEGSDWSYSRFFLQKAFDNGWRLENEAPPFWAALKDVAGRKGGDAKRTGFRTAWVIDAVHAFLLDNMKKDAANFRGNQTLWSDCLLSGTEQDLIV